MGQASSFRIVKPALAVALSAVLAVSAPLDAARAFAADSAASGSAGGGGVPELLEGSAASDGPGASATDGDAQHVETVKLPELAPSEEGAPEKTPAGEGPATDVSPSKNPSSDTANSSNAPEASSQAAGDAPLAPENPKPTIGEIRAEGLVYRILADGASVALVGWRGAAPAGNVTVPAEVESGGDSYAVARVGGLDEKGSPVRVLAGSAATSITLPSAVREVSEGALCGCPTLARIEVSPKNDSFASFDGMLFTKDLTSLLTFPEGKEGVARIPDQTTTVPASALSQAPGLLWVEVGEGSVSFASENGVLYSLDMKTLLACPPGAGEAAVIPEGVEAIGPGAFAGCGELASIAALGHVREIASDAFTEEARANAVVALPAGAGYDARRAVWEAAGFTRFAEPARPGDVAGPGAGAGEPGAGEPSADLGSGEPGAEAPAASGLAYTLLDDYTLSVSWQGAEDPEPDLSIPAAAEVGGASYRVSAVAAGAFANRASLASVELPASVTGIGEAAFAGCANLGGISLPEGLRAIGPRAFEAAGLTDVWLPESVSSVGARAFAACSSLTRVVALGAPEVAADALAECAGVSVFCPAGSEAPWNMGLPAAGNHLMPYGISLPDEPLALEAGQSASLLDGGQLNAPDPIETSYSYAAKPLSVDPDGTATGKAAGTSEVTATLTLEGRELARATRTVEVTPAPEAPTPGAEAPESSALQGSYDLGNTSMISQTAMLMPVQERAAASAEVVDGDLTYTLLEDGTLGVKATNRLTIKEALIPSKHSYLDKGELPVTKVLADGFAGGAQGNELDKVVLPDTIREIEAQAFQGCSKLVSIMLPASVNVLGKHALRNCTSMTSIEVDPLNEAFASIDGILYSKDGTRLVRFPQGRDGSFVVPDDVVSIGELAFYGVPLISVEFPITLKTIEVDAFAQCGHLISIDVPDSVTSIGTRAFYNNVSLESAKLPKGLQVIEGDLFYGDAKLSSVTMPEAYSVLGVRAFGDCASLTSLTIPSSVRTILAKALENCTGLQVLDIKTTDVSIVANAFFGCSALKAVCAYGALGASGIGAAFDATAKSGAAVLLPQAAQDGSVDNFATMASVWKNTHGFSKVSGTEGVLPTEGNTQDGRWELTGDGTLRIWCERAGAVIQNLGWTFNAWDDGAWGPVRAAVKRVVMEASVDAVDTNFWFAGMPGLRTIEGIFVPKSATEAYGMFAYGQFDTVPDDFVLPEGLVNMRAMFHSCANIKILPDRFQLPDSSENLQGMFINCTSLESLNASFAIPDKGKVRNMHGMLSGTAIEALPDGFTMPDSVSTAAALFEGCSNLKELPAQFKISAGIVDDGAGNLFAGCSSLVSLPDGFSIPSNVTWTYGMFTGCSSLTSLPDNFKIPASVNNFMRMFEGCTSLASLPANFDMPIPVGADWLAGVFAVEGERLPIYYAGSNESILSKYPWDQANRTLVMSSGKPANAKAVTLNVKAQDEAGAGSWWTTVYTDTSGLLAEPAAPARPGHVFALWYADEACTQRVDFSQPFAADTTLYGKFAPGTRGGALPTEAGTGSAWWSLADDGSLYLRGAGMVDMQMPDTDNQEGANKFWGLDRAQVRKIAMSPSFDALYAHNWFRDMTNLVDLTEAFIPKSASILHRMFANCTSLVTLPEGFSIPDKVKNMASIFNHCSSLVSLPSSLFFSDSSEINNVSYAFNDCSSLASLPERFTLPSNMLAQGLSGAFDACPSLTRIPDGFEMPEGAKNNHVFGTGVSAGQPRILTYYAGSNRSVLEYDWESQGRTLVTSEGDMGDFGMQRVTFKLQSADEAAGFPWETRSVAWSNKQGIVADPGSPVLDGYQFSGWCTDEECLEAFDFSKPVTAETTLYGTWVIAGAKNAVERAGGELPCIDDAGNPFSSAAWWRITADGTLEIKGDGKVGDLKLSWNVNTTSRDYWETYRDRVTCIQMEKNLKALTMRAWFCRMPNLIDVSGMFVPVGCVNVNDMLYDCPLLSSLPDGFKLPDSVDSAESFLQSCRSLTNLPESFVLPSHMWKVAGMFRYCSKLESLPSGFTIPEGTQFVGSMFEGCHSLKSLPEGFSIPQSVTDMPLIFWGCNALTSLPASFDFPLAVAEAAEDPFLFTGDGVLDTYFAGGADSASNVLKYSKWASQNRTITTELPAGKAFVDLMLPDAEPGVFKTWTRQLADVGATVAEPAAPTREGATFVGWYTEAACTTKYDFATGTVPEAGLVLYAKYYAHGGALPTTDGGTNASWELSADGTLTIACQPGATIADLGWTSDKGSDTYFSSGYWGPVRGQVKRVVMDSGLKARSMAFWFDSMSSLADISNVYIPQGVTSLRNAFATCPRLTSLPEDLVIPDGVKDMANCFLNCSGIAKLPEGIAFPDTVTDMSGCFARCSLTALPAGFRLPGNLELAHNMFLSSKLISLPTGFLLPDSIQNASHMFMGSALASLPAGFGLPTGYQGLNCEGAFEATNIAALPAGFTVPANVAHAESLFRSTPLAALPEGFAVENPETLVMNMFENCPELTWIPASLKLIEMQTAGTSLVNMFGWVSSLPGYTPDVVTTYYGGFLDDVLGSDYWKTEYNRDLASAEAGLPANTYKVTYNLQKPGAAASEAWMTVLAQPGEDGSAHVAKPVDPTLFGYAFSGWKAKDAGGALSDFDFTQPVTSNVELYGTYALVTSVDVPFQAKVSVDALGNVEPAAVEFTSRTPAALKLAAVAAEEAPGASKLFPNASERAGVEAVVGLGRNSFRVPLGAGSQDLAGGRMDAATPGASTSLPATLSLERNGAQIDFQPGEDITSFAKLTWTIELAA